MKWIIPWEPDRKTEDIDKNMDKHLHMFIDLNGFSVYAYYLNDKMCGGPGGRLKGGSGDGGWGGRASR